MSTMRNTTNDAIAIQAPIGETRSPAGQLGVTGDLASLTRSVWFLIVTMAGVAAISFWLLGLSIDLSSNRSLVAIAVCYAGLVLFYRRVRPDPLIAAPAEAIGQLFIVLF